MVRLQPKKNTPPFRNPRSRSETPSLPEVGQEGEETFSYRVNERQFQLCLNPSTELWIVVGSDGEAMVRKLTREFCIRVHVQERWGRGQQPFRSHDEAKKVRLILAGPPEQLQEARACYLNKNSQYWAAYTDRDGHRMINTGQVLVKFNCNMGERLKEFENHYQLNLDRELHRTYVYDTCWENNPHRPLTLAAELDRDDRVCFAEPNFLITPHQHFSRADANPIEPMVTSQWHLHGLSMDGNSLPGHVHANHAWHRLEEIGVKHGGSPDIIVGLIDTPVDTSHPDLAANIYKPAGPNQESGGSTDFHGTANAGLIAAVAGNGIGVKGVAPGCRLYPIDLSTSSETVDLADILFKAKGPCRILCCPWSVPYSADITDAIDKVTTPQSGEPGLAIFASTGNECSNAVDFPASHEKVMAVGASTSLDFHARHYSNHGVGINFVAPSSGRADKNEKHTLVTLDVHGDAGFTLPDFPYIEEDFSDAFGQTSGAAAIAAGVAALVLSANPNLTVDQLKAILEKTCDYPLFEDCNGYREPLGLPWNKKVGYGRLNAARAVEKAIRPY